jgi:hypothetical protein
MLNVSSTARDLLVRSLRVFLICLAIGAGFLVLAALYLGFRYGWHSVARAFAPEDARDWGKAALLFAGVCTAAYVLDRLLNGAFTRFFRARR